MTADETAQVHAERPGYELVDFAEVTLPVYKVYMAVSLLLHTPLPPVYEFVLRALRLGIDDAAAVAECLGIPPLMVSEVLERLHQSEEIAFKVDGDAHDAVDRFVLTRKGEKTTVALERVRPEQQTLPILFDGLLRKPIEPLAVQLLSGKQPAELGMKEIPALPATRVEVSDIDLPAAARLLVRGGEGKRDLLAIRSIERRMRLHMPAVALVFRQIDGEEIDLQFAMESRMLDEHNRAFALAEGASKTRILADFGKPSLVGSGSLVRKIEKLAKSAQEPPAAAGKAKLTIRAKPIAAPGSIETLTMLDHAPLLWDAVATATTRVLIMSPWITAQVIDRPALDLLRKLLERRIDLYVGYGIEEGPRRPVPNELLQLASAFESFRLVDFGDTHEKLLLKDSEFAVIGSFNWLSFRGDAGRKLRGERSYKVSDPALVEREFASMEARFRAKLRRAESRIDGG